MTTRASDALVAVLTEAQRLGMLGDRPVPAVVDHAGAFVDALVGVSGSVIDLGSGGGVPGLVIAEARTDLEVLLVDRRERRTDFLRRAVSRLGFGDRVSVRCVDAAVLAASEPRSSDGVVARGFGPPELTLRLSEALIRDAGRIVISEPPPSAGDRWPVEVVEALGLRRERHGSVSVFERISHDRRA